MKHLLLKIMSLLLLVSTIATAQNRTITGTVTSADDKQPMPSVTVEVKGSNTAAQTDVNGKFSISAAEGSTLVFSYIGYAQREARVGSSDVLNVTLNGDAKQLGEVVVTALGIKKDAKKVGYATGLVKGDDLNTAREINVANSLSGRVAGVSVSSPASGPGGSSNVIIRGVSSLTGSSQPLYVINGIPMDNSNMGFAGTWGGADRGDGISTINPDDIESISVLKGGGAAALYGSRASAGVIMITTKSGKAQKGLGVEFNSNYQMELINNQTDYQYVYGSGVLGAKPVDAGSARAAGMMSWGAKLDGSNVINYDGVARPYSAQKNNMDNFYREGGTFTNTLALSGGSENAAYRFSASKLKNNSVVPNTGLDRWNFNFGSNFKLGKQLTADVKVNYTSESATKRPMLSDSPGNANFGIAFLGNSIDQSILAPGTNPNGSEVQFGANEYATNPYFAVNNWVNDSKRNRVIGNVNLKYQINPWLFVQGRVAQDYFNDSFLSATPSGTAYKPEGILDNQSTTRFSELNTDLLVGITRQLSSSISLDATAGGNLMKRNSVISTQSGQGFALPKIYNSSNVVAPNAAGYLNPRSEVQSVYGTVDLGYKNFLYLNLSGRNDWFSTLAPSNNLSYFYPAVSTSFVFTELTKPSWLSYGKLRASYSEVGGGAQDPYQTLLNYGILGVINGVPLGQVSSINIPNSVLLPMGVKEFEVGTDLKFFQNRLGVDFSFYNKEITNDIVPVTASATSGYQAAVLNIGSQRNRGVELMLTGAVVKSSQGLNWTTSVNGSINNNTVLSLADGLEEIQVGVSRTQNAFIKQVVGKPASQVVAFDFARDGNNNIVTNPDGSPKKGELKEYGSGVHKYNAGWNNEFSYKGVNFSFLLDGKFGAKIFSATNLYAYQFGLHKETLAKREELGASAQTYYGAASAISGQFVQDASFIKLRQMSLGYTIPSSLFNNRIQSMTLSVVGRNLAILMKKTDNIDPESNYNNTAAQGLELAGVPPVRSFGLNLSIKF